MLKGLIRVLLEQEEGCCENVAALFSDAVTKDVANFEDIIIYKTSVDLRNETNGESAETMYNNAEDLNTQCQILNTLLLIYEDGALNTVAKQKIDDIQAEVCPEIEDPEIISSTETQTCTAPSDDPNGMSWYKFDYNGQYSPQVRQDFYRLVLDKLGIRNGVFAPGQEGECIERIQVWEQKPDEMVVSPTFTGNKAPKLDWWKGFKISCACIPADSPYKETNLKIYELDHPYIKGVGVPVEKTSSNSQTDNTSVDVSDNVSDDNLNVSTNDGLQNVLNRPENPYPEITFL